MKPEDLISVIRAVTMCSLAAVCIAALCATLFFKNYADPTVLVTLVGATNLLLGYLAGKRSTQSEDATTKPVETKKPDENKTITTDNPNG